MSRTKEALTCKTSGRIYRIGGKETFLYSGEVHYFRIPRRYWEKHFQALLDAHCNAVSTYVPWSWHEYREGTFDLTGKSHPERDLKGFLDLAGKMGLHVTVKPGPYIMAETTDQGIPRWLTDNYAETRAIDHLGNEWGPDFICYASPIFRNRAERWLRKFAKQIVAPRQGRKQGAVLQMQLCNEIGMFQWLGSKGDFSEANVAAWHTYLRNRFASTAELEQLLDRPIKAFEELQPPHGACTSRREYILYDLWHDYHRHLYAEYVAFVGDTLRDAGARVPFFTNVGGWVYGRAHEFPLNATFHRLTAKKRPDVFYGIDHIPEFVSPLNSHDGIVATQVVDELQGRNQPLYSAELQCGSREHGVQPYPDELALFYRQCLIHGLTGMNFYMFAQGRNPKGRGIDGPMFYWYNAVNYKAQRQEVYPVIESVGAWLKQNGTSLIRMQKPAELALAYYPPMYESEFLYPKLQKAQRVELDQIGIMDPVAFRDQAYFDGVIRILVKQSIPYDMADLTNRTVDELLKYKELVLVTNECMDADTQSKLVEFLKRGGKLVIFPMAPCYDLEFNPCTILADFMKISSAGRAKSRRIYMDKLKDIPVPMTPFVLDDNGAQIIARTADKETVGVEKRCGRGRVRYFGFYLHYTIEEHPLLWSAMMRLTDIPRNAWAENDAMQVEARFSNEEGVLFAGNIHRAPVTSAVSVANPADNSRIELGKLTLPPLTGLLLPVRVKLRKGLYMLFAHGELLDRQVQGQTVKIALRGPEGSRGRIVLEADKAPGEITVDGKAVKVSSQGKRHEVSYAQNGKIQRICVQA
jgi:beta-galactosidase